MSCRDSRQLGCQSLPNSCPTGLAWAPNGNLYVTSLKGRVWLARDTTGDGLQDSFTAFSDELAAPYGLAATSEHVDVVTKYGLLRLFDDDHDGRAERLQVVASGWGHTTDYHDWAVGLPQDEAGNYYVALPCQQDDRSIAAAHLRGTVARLVPRAPTRDNPREFSIEPLTGGHRFPMGLALRQDGDLFVTDNPGELQSFQMNLITSCGAGTLGSSMHWERGGSPPQLTKPAIDLPHPWTRSVNWHLLSRWFRRLDAAPPDTDSVRFEGHLIGCEMDSRRPRSNDPAGGWWRNPGSGLPLQLRRAKNPARRCWGPLICAVAPDGSLFVGGVHDSGWGGGNNIGEIVRLRPLPGGPPLRDRRSTGRDRWIPGGLYFSSQFRRGGRPQRIGPFRPTLGHRPRLTAVKTS